MAQSCQFSTHLFGNFLDRYIWLSKKCGYFCFQIWPKMKKKKVKIEKGIGICRGTLTKIHMSRKQSIKKKKSLKHQFQSKLIKINIKYLEVPTYLYSF